MTLLSKQDILGSQDAKTQELDVPEWGGKVRVSTMSGFARDRFEASCIGKNGGVKHDNIRAKLVAACLIDDKGELLFTEKDVTALGKKSCSALDRIFAAAQTLNGIGDDEVEALAKN